MYNLINAFEKYTFELFIYYQVLTLIWKNRPVNFQSKSGVKPQGRKYLSSILIICNQSTRGGGVTH